MAYDAILVGLGNPGPRYFSTRHNIGFLALDALAERENVNFEDSSSKSKKLKAHIATFTWNSKKILLLKPQTFMNLSGESIRSLYQDDSSLKEAPLIVFHDEVDLAFGKLRVKLGGGDAGHNGLKSIRACIGHGDYYRIRMGVGRPGPEDSRVLADYVLSSFEKQELVVLKNEIEQSLRVAEALLFKNLEAALVEASLETR